LLVWVELLLSDPFQGTEARRKYTKEARKVFACLWFPTGWAWLFTSRTSSILFYFELLQGWRGLDVVRRILDSIFELESWFSVQ